MVGCRQGSVDWLRVLPPVLASPQPSISLERPEHAVELGGKLPSRRGGNIIEVAYVLRLNEVRFAVSTVHVDERLAPKLLPCAVPLSQLNHVHSRDGEAD